MRKLLLLPFFLILIAACSDQEEPAGAEIGATDVSRTEAEGREIVDNGFHFANETIIMSDWGSTEFVAILDAADLTPSDIDINDIKVVGAYSYDYSKFGTDLDPWEEIGLDKVDPATADWLSVEVANNKGNIGILITASALIPNMSPGKPYPDDRAIKLDVEIGINELQRAVCSIMVVQQLSLDDSNITPDNGRLFSFSEPTEFNVSADGARGSIRMCYNASGYERLTAQGYKIPAKIELQSLLLGRRYDVPEDEEELEALELPRGITDSYWTFYEAGRIMNADGIYDLGWAKIKVINNPDGSKIFEYEITENTLGILREVQITDTPDFIGPEYSLCRYRVSSHLWSIIISQPSK